MIAVRALRYRFPETSFDALAGIDWHAAPGSFTLVAGQSGSGKSTLLRCLNGLIPHFHGGHFGGEVIVAGRDTRTSAPRDLATVIGSVFQEPEAQLITDTVHDEIAFALENLGFSRREVSERLAGISARLGIEHLRERRISTLSGGERQLVALAAALAPGPPALVLDEPTSQLDPDATAALLDTLAGLHRAEGLTAVIAEHRIERLCPLADAVLHLSDGRSNLLQRATATAALESDGLLAGRGAAAFTVDSPEPGETLVELRDLRFSYGARMALDGVSLDLHAGEAVALMGPNGSGKTTLLKHLIGLLRPDAGSVLIAGQGIAGRPVHEIAASVGYVPQQPSLILHRETLRDELRFTLDALGRVGDIDATLELLGIGDLAAKHPLDLSGGERQRAAIAAIAVGSPRVLLLDEPTRGLPWSEKQRLAGSLRRFAGNGRLVVVATHDFAFAAALGGRILRLVSGRINGIEVSGIHSGARTDTVDQSKRFDRSVLTPSKAG